METHVLDQIVRQTNEHTREAVEAILAGKAASAFDAIVPGVGVSSSMPKTISATPISRGISPRCRLRSARQRSCSIAPATTAGGSPMRSGSRSCTTARSARMPWSPACSNRAD
ncbi:hypothetical protein FHR23_003173 [Stakelama sediminis]|uniref:Uncharacterized protein n=1 Tax=Stakelama sediminis TaxID=463200 RepID=A0A840Z3A7_9SPHN|nr:hypothetical protein [Stakelama sediminis]MBB5720210.1 hypothetical protein [Stakelama sediminis]